MKETMIFERKESAIESVISDAVTFGFLLLCMWFSYSQGGGWWTFFTCSMFFISLSAKLSMRANARWVKLTSKKEALGWANSLPNDVEPATPKEPQT